MTTPDQDTRLSRLRPLMQCGRRWTRAAGVSRPIPSFTTPPAAPAHSMDTHQGAAPVGRPKTAKLAHLFLVRANLHQEAMWEEFFSEADDAFSVYVHPKWPERVTTRLFRHRIVPGLCPTEYGRISIVQAELCLLRAAIRDEANQFFLLHSESCIPIRPFSRVYQELFSLGKSWLNYHQGSMCRHSGIDGRLVPEEHFYKASQFFCLSRPHVERILANCDLTAWKNATAPEEHHFPTKLAAWARWESVPAETLLSPIGIHLAASPTRVRRPSMPCCPTTWPDCKPPTAFFAKVRHRQRRIAARSHRRCESNDVNDLKSFPRRAASVKIDAGRTSIPV